MHGGNLAYTRAGTESPSMSMKHRMANDASHGWSETTVLSSPNFTKLRGSKPRFSARLCRVGFGGDKTRHIFGVSLCHSTCDSSPKETLESLDRGRDKRINHPQKSKRRAWGTLVAHRMAFTKTVFSPSSSRILGFVLPAE